MHCLLRCKSPLLADSVAKGFLAAKRATLIRRPRAGGKEESKHLARQNEHCVAFPRGRLLQHYLPIAVIAMAGTLDFGPSDHKPIVLELQVATAAVKRHPLQRAKRSLAKIRAALR